MFTSCWLLVSWLTGFRFVISHVYLYISSRRGHFTFFHVIPDIDPETLILVHPSSDLSPARVSRSVSAMPFTYARRTGILPTGRYECIS